MSYVRQQRTNKVQILVIYESIFSPTQNHKFHSRDISGNLL